MLELEAALARILAAIPGPVSELLDLTSACGRVAAERITAPIDLPVFDNSSMDGFAVRAADVAAATPGKPIGLRVIGRVPAGKSFEGELTGGTAVRLFTGSPLPRGADAIVMQEDTRTEPARPDEVLVLEPVKPSENVRFRGEDVKRGAPLVEAGEIVSAGRMALLSACGLAQLRAGCRPVVGLLATGSELKEPGAPLAPGQIYESNRNTLAPLIERAGGGPRRYPIVPDEPAATRAALERAFNECGFVVTCGGVSVGEMDFVKSAFEALGGKLQFWKVAIKPGRPFVFGSLGDKCLFGLPGNPVSALVTFLLLVRPALLRGQGCRDISLPVHPATLVEPLSNTGSRRHFVRVRVDHAGNVRSAGTQASHILSSVAAANGLVDVKPGMVFATGSVVPVLRWD